MRTQKRTVIQMAEYLCEEDMNTGEYISRDVALRQLNATCLATDCNNYNGVMCRACAYADAMDFIDAIPAADVQPVVDTENMATLSDEFICKKCGIYLKDYIKVVMDEDNDGYIDEQHYEYEPKFCPECGAKVKDGDTNG